MQQMLKLDAEAGEPSSTKNFNQLLTAVRLLDSANQMISTDINAAFLSNLI
jgi:hypothetical protein